MFKSVRRHTLATIAVLLAAPTAYAGISKQGFSPQGFSAQGFSPQGFSAQGFSPQGFSAQGFSAQGFSPQGFSAQGFSAQGFSAQGFSAQGFSAQGFSPQGFSAQGFSAQGFSVQGFSPQGFSAQGFSAQGFSAQGGALNNLAFTAALVGSQLIGDNEGTIVSGAEVIGAALPYYAIPDDPNQEPLLVIVRDVYQDVADPNIMVDASHADNSDVFLYKLTIPFLIWDEVDDGDGNLVWQAVNVVEVNLCGGFEGTDPAEEYGMFFEGVTDLNGVMHPGALSFSCRSGTMTKAARAFGYKPWVDYGVAETGYQLWNAMWNGAMANYCGDIHNSFTVNGTTVDVEDVYGLNVKTAENDVYSFAPETDWSPATAGLSHFYEQRLSFDPDGLKVYWCSDYVPHSGETVAALESGLRIHTSRLCMHPANMVGTPLSENCNPCTKLVKDAGGNDTCFSHSWAPSCVAAAATLCAADEETADATGYYSGTANLNLSL